MIVSGWSYICGCLKDAYFIYDSHGSKAMLGSEQTAIITTTHSSVFVDRQHRVFQPGLTRGPLISNPKTFPQSRYQLRCRC